MFNSDIRPTPRPFSEVIGLGRLFETPFDRRQRKIARKIEQLKSMDDASLAELGLTRDEIVMHVFKSV